VLGDPVAVAAALAELEERPGEGTGSVRVLGSYPATAPS